MLNSWDQLFGHDEQRLLLRRSVVQGRLSHAYAFCGPDGIGKLQFARLFAASMFCRNCSPEELNVCGDCRACTAFFAGNWPDYHEIGVPAGKSEIPVSAVIGDREHRGRAGLCFELSAGPQASDRRIAVIDSAHAMNAEAANALLKTLEEPPADAVLLLLCDDANSLLPTIRSRCQLLRFFPLSPDHVARILIREEMAESEDQARAVARLSDGSVETAAQLLSESLRTLRTTVSDQLRRFDRMKPLDSVNVIMEGIESVGSNAAEQRMAAQWVLRFTADAVRSQLRSLAEGNMSDPLTARLGIRGGIDVLAPMLQRTMTASVHIDGMTPVRLALDALFHDLASMARAAG